MKIAILSSIILGPSGGGNQFLKGLRKYFNLRNIYADNVFEADCILVNSHHWMKDLPLVLYAIVVHNKKFVHRVDGPLGLTRGDSARQLDKLIARFNKNICSATIFQSNWSKQNCINRGFDPDKKSIVIINGVDSDLFYRKRDVYFSGKVKIVMNSWSSNMNKGFELYRYIDDNLDFDEYDVTFIGNSPVDFKNIKIIPPLPSNVLADEMRRHHIYLTASINDPCSNSLIEAISVGLYPLAINSGGHPELLNNCGLLFNSKADVIAALNQARDRIRSKFGSNCRTIENVGGEYVDFFREVCSSKNSVSRVKAAAFAPEVVLRVMFFYLSSYIDTFSRK